MCNGESSSLVVQGQNRCGSLDLCKSEIRVTRRSATQKSLLQRYKPPHCHICFSRLLRTRAVVGEFNSQFFQTHWGKIKIKINMLYVINVKYHIVQKLLVLT